MIQRNKNMKSIVIIGLFLIPILIFTLKVEVKNVFAETEPNNNFAQANEVSTSGATQTGVVRTQDFSDIWDYYKVSCQGGTTLTLVASAGVYGQDVCYVDVFDPNYVLLDSFYSDETINDFVTCVVDGWHYFRISCDAPGTPSYSVTPTFTKDTTPPELAWVSPASGEIEFGTNPDANHALFNISYTEANLQKVELWLNGEFNNELSSSPAQINLMYNETINGAVTATLKGYSSSVVAIERSRSFTFKKVISYDDDQLVASGTKNIGKKLYSILYDPNGDLSWSAWEETSTMSLLVGAELSMTVGVELSVEEDFILFGGGASFGIEVTAEAGFEWRYEITNFVEIHSVDVDNGPAELSGPGRGDVYWGETWEIPWQLYVQNKTYWDGSKDYDEQTLKYGIQRSATSILTETDAPEEWRNQSAVYLGYPSEHVYWLDNNSHVSGGIGNALSVSEEISTTSTQSHSLALGISSTLSFEIWGVDTEISLELETKVSKETSLGHSVKKIYNIGDDDAGDQLYHRIGYDKRFGTYVFATNPGTNTSNPHEFDTINYVAPTVEDHSIVYDTSGDSIGPCENDEPEITAEISDDGEVIDALLYYSNNSGVNWHTSQMTQSVMDEADWIGSIPSQEHGTEILWYILAEDNYGLTSEYKDPFDDPFSYTVLNRNPVVLITNPVGGENFTVDTISITWVGSDPDGDSLTYDVSYNINNEGWHLLAENLTVLIYHWDISGVDYAESVLVKVVANDGFGGTAEDTPERGESLADQEQSTDHAHAPPQVRRPSVVQLLPRSRPPLLRLRQFNGALPGRDAGTAAGCKSHHPHCRYNRRCSRPPGQSA